MNLGITLASIFGYSLSHSGRLEILHSTCPSHWLYDSLSLSLVLGTEEAKQQHIAGGFPMQTSIICDRRLFVLVCKESDSSKGSISGWECDARARG